MTLLSHNDHAQATAVKAAITGALRGTWQARDFDESTSDPIHVYVAVTRRFGSPERICGYPPGTAWRFVARCIGEDIGAARAAMEDVAALEGTRIVVDGVTSQPIQFESASAPEPDDGWFSGQSTWTYSF